MSSQQPSRRRRLLPPAEPQAPAPTSIRDLGDDLLLLIFLHLPSLPSLVRAALICRAFLTAVRSSPAFRRQFRALHATTLLGIFLDERFIDVSSYAPLRRISEPDLDAAVRASDYFIAGIPDEITDAQFEWVVKDCRGGYVLLCERWPGRMAVYNPLTGALHFFCAPRNEIARGSNYRKFISLGYHMLDCDDKSGSFRVAIICRDGSRRLRAAIFSSGTREWQILPWTGGAPAQPWCKQLQLRTGALVNGSLYFSNAYSNKKRKKVFYSLVLNTTTLQFSWIDLPDQLKGQEHVYSIGETKDGNLCIASIIAFTLFIWLRRSDTDGVEKWSLDSLIPLQGEVLRTVHFGVFEVWAILDGIVHLLARTFIGDTCWFLSFCLETKQLKKIFSKAFKSVVYPYIMAWPPSLIGNNVGA